MPSIGDLAAGSATVHDMADSFGQLSPDGRWRWDGREWVASGFAGLEPRINPLAVAAFVSALVVPLWPLSSITAVILGWVAVRQIAERPSERGRALAFAGVVVGLVVIVALSIGLALSWGYLARS